MRRWSGPIGGQTRYWRAPETSDAFQARADTGQVDGVGVGDEKHRVRIADADTAGVAKGVGERHMSAVNGRGERMSAAANAPVPCRRRSGHRRRAAVELAGDGLDGQRLIAALFHQQRRHTARAIAAGLGDAAVGLWMSIRTAGGGRRPRSKTGRSQCPGDGRPWPGFAPRSAPARRARQRSRNHCRGRAF